MYGPTAACAWHDERDEALAAERARLTARQTRTVLFEPLPKTSTGKIQKFALCERSQKKRAAEAALKRSTLLGDYCVAQTLKIVPVPGN